MMKYFAIFEKYFALKKVFETFSSILFSRFYKPMQYRCVITNKSR